TTASLENLACPVYGGISKNVKPRVRRASQRAAPPLGRAPMKKAPEGAFQKARCLQHLDFRRLRTLGAVSRHEADALVFFQRLEAVGLDFREVREQILAARFRGDEAVAFFRVEPLNNAGF